jgi:phosphatidate cytidylyltransferase
LDTSPPPGGTTPAGPPSPSRAGRNLPAAIAVGVGLGGVALLTLYTVPATFVALVCVALLLAMWEVCRALGGAGLHPPVPPLAAGGVAMLISAYAGGTGALLAALVLTVLGVLVWRLFLGNDGFVADAAAGLLVATYLPLLGGFVMLLLADDHGARQVTVYISLVVASDVGGYTAGVLAGKHPMAPAISPKKSWEGFAGSVVAGAVVGAILLATVLHTDWWRGVLLGVAVVVAAVVGDLVESVIKRDLGIKDMGTLLPGHGGVMDRLDSILFAVPTAYLLFAVIAANRL